MHSWNNKVLSDLPEFISTENQLLLYVRVDQIVDHNMATEEKENDLRGIVNDLTTFEKTGKPMRYELVKIVKNALVNPINRGKTP